MVPTTPLFLSITWSHGPCISDVLLTTTSREGRLTTEEERLKRFDGVSVLVLGVHITTKTVDK